MIFYTEFLLQLQRHRRLFSRCIPRDCPAPPPLPLPVHQRKFRLERPLLLLAFPAFWFCSASAAAHNRRRPGPWKPGTSRSNLQYRAPRRVTPVCDPQSCVVRAWVSDTLLIEAVKPITARRLSFVGDKVAFPAHETLVCDPRPGAAVSATFTSNTSLPLLIAVSCRPVIISKQLLSNPDLLLSLIFAQLPFPSHVQPPARQRQPSAPAVAVPRTRAFRFFRQRL
jgi:hypothetical protein